MNEVTTILRREVGSADVKVQVRDLYWTGPLEVLHRRPDHVLTLFLVKSNRVHAESRFDDRIVGEMGTLCLVPANIPCYTRTLDGPNRRTRTRVVQCHFEPERFKQVTCLEGWDDEQLNDCLDIRSPLISETVGHLVQETVAPGFASEIFVNALGTSLMVALARHLGRSKKETDVGEGKLAPWLMQRLTDYVESCSERLITAAELADVCGISADHLRRAFKQTTGQTLHGYVQQCRLVKAKELLIDTDLPIAEIAGRLGFAHSSNFSVAFYRLTGQQPMAFRQMLRGWR